MNDFEFDFDLIESLATLNLSRRKNYCFLRSRVSLALASNLSSFYINRMESLSWQSDISRCRPFQSEHFPEWQLSTIICYLYNRRERYSYSPLSTVYTFALNIGYQSAVGVLICVDRPKLSPLSVSALVCTYTLDYCLQLWGHRWNVSPLPVPLEPFWLRSPLPWSWRSLPTPGELFWTSRPMYVYNMLQYYVWSVCLLIVDTRVQLHQHLSSDACIQTCASIAVIDHQIIWGLLAKRCAVRKFKLVVCVLCDCTVRVLQLMEIYLRRILIQIYGVPCGVTPLHTWVRGGHDLFWVNFVSTIFDEVGVSLVFLSCAVYCRLSLPFSTCIYVCRYVHIIHTWVVWIFIATIILY